MQKDSKDKLQLADKSDLVPVLQGKFELSVKAVLADAWRATPGNIGPLLIGFMVIFGIMICLFLIFNSMVFQIEDQNDPALSQLSWVIQLLTAPFMAGLVLMGIRLGQGISCSPRNVFDALPRALPVLLAFVIISAIGIIVGGLLQAILPILMLLFALYLGIATIIVVPLLVTHEVSVLNALYYSFLIVHKRFSQFTLIYLACVGLLIVSILTLGLGFIWSIPFIYTLYGVVYRQLFGVRDVALV